MKKISTLLLFCITLLFSSASMAQSTDYFVGDWKVEIKDSPMGTINVVLTLERVAGKLEGKFVDNVTGMETRMNNIIENENSLKLNYNAEGYGNFYYTLIRVGDDNVSGSMMDSFEVSGTRVKK